MLELAQIVSDIHRMSRVAQERVTRAESRIALAWDCLTRAGSDWADRRNDLAGREAPWQFAQCPSDTPGAVCPLPHHAPAEYSALATDGSQIPLDRHAIAPCYLINVGEIALHYGTGERPRLTSRATLHYQDDEVFENDGVEPVSEKWIANRRSRAESAALATLISENANRHAVALVDGPLILFMPKGESESYREDIVREFCAMLEAGRDAAIPVAGYISRPRHRDVVGLIRLMLCPPGCDHAEGSPCGAVRHLSDAALFARLLTRTGDRSAIFASASPHLKPYPEPHKIAFFYLNVGVEIARVEIPIWVAEDLALRDRVHVLTHDQSVKGLGYPIALAEAHERAVVRGAEREAFFRLMENAFIRDGVAAIRTRKAVAKRSPMV